MNDTSGFYSLDSNGYLLFAPNSVHGPDYTLFRAEHANYSYPNHGWTWFDDEASAKTALNSKERPLQPTPQPRPRA